MPDAPSGPEPTTPRAEDLIAQATRLRETLDHLLDQVTKLIAETKALADKLRRPLTPEEHDG